MTQDVAASKDDLPTASTPNTLVAVVVFFGRLEFPNIIKPAGTV
jgi:hypothetical protein